ncbi:MAG: hypothetical protein PHE32_04010 [Candidatus Shapirobacteria bacterium]|nr:hypothetical protein [Candidatus Shapirobacteria bacterium]
MNNQINNVCDKCGLEANRKTCLLKYGNEPMMKKFHTSTYHKGKCNCCGEETSITETRDFFYPRFDLFNIPDEALLQLRSDIDRMAYRETKIRLEKLKNKYAKIS